MEKTNYLENFGLIFEIRARNLSASNIDDFVQDIKIHLIQTKLRIAESSIFFWDFLFVRLELEFELSEFKLF